MYFCNSVNEAVSCTYDTMEVAEHRPSVEQWIWGNCIYRNVPKYRNELEIPKRIIKYIGKGRFGS